MVGRRLPGAAAGAAGAGLRPNPVLTSKLGAQHCVARRHQRIVGSQVETLSVQPRTAAAVKGRDQDTALLLSVSRADAGSRRRGLRVWSVGTPVAKGELYRWLKLAWPAHGRPPASLLEADEALEAGASYPPGACHFPQYGEEYFSQLTAERLVTRIIKGFPRGSWEKEPGRRNEALDCRVYARAAAAICGIDRWPEAHWRELERHLGREEEAVSAAAGPSAEQSPPGHPEGPARRWLPGRREDWLGRATRRSWWDR